MKQEEKQKNTKDRFEWLLKKNRNYYEKQTKQDEQVNRIIQNLHINEGSRIIDLGTGTGYLAFTIARKYKNVWITGMEIVEKTLAVNSESAKSKNLSQLDFIFTDGTKLSLDNESVDIIVTRFALHHFVDIEESFREFFRVLKKGGQLFICDPTPNENDPDKIIDRFMQLTNDGHISFYTRKELVDLGKKNNLVEEKCYLSDVYFPSDTRTAGYLKIEKEIPEEIKKGYQFEIKDKEVFAREKVLNISFIKK